MKYRLLLALSVITFAAHAMEEDKSDTGDSLHELAREKNYYGCLRLLADTSWIQKPLPGKAVFPPDPPEKIWGMGQKEIASFNSESAKKLGLFMVTMQKYKDHHVARAVAMKTALNVLADTPQDCAREAGGSEKLLSLLDPRNNVANEAIGAAISTLFRQYRSTGQRIVIVMEKK